MPRIAAVDPKTDAPTITYVHEKQSNARVQLLAEDDVRDARGRLLQKGRVLRADFMKGKFSTNIPEYIKLLEDSIAYRTGRIERLDVLTKRANDQLLARTLEMLESNPELARELRSKLTSKQIAAAKVKKAAKVEPDSEPEDEAIYLYREDAIGTEEE